jgi:hypothetical protein
MLTTVLAGTAVARGEAVMLNSPQADLLSTTNLTPDLAPLLRGLPALSPEHYWEGEFTGARGAAQNCTIGVKAQIGFHGHLIEGAGRAVTFPAEFSDTDASFSLSGVLSFDSVSFQLWFGASQIRHEPFIGSGMLSSDGREIGGDWSVQCFDPETCGCEGGGGVFRLKRID